jgi:hypothetical protein
MDLTLEGLKMNQESRNMNPCSCNIVILPGPVFAHGATGTKRTVGAPAPPYIKICKKKCKALQYCDSNEFIELAVGTSRVLMSKAAINNIFSNKHKA